MYSGVLPQDNIVPIGCVLPYAGLLAATDAKKEDIEQIKSNLASAGWLSCDGSSLPRDDYWLLFGVIGYTFGGSGDNFNLPDLRGRFIRGVDGGAGQDPSIDKRKASLTGGNTGDKVGSLQPDAYQGHEHHYKAANVPSSLKTGGTSIYGPSLSTQPTTDQLEDFAGQYGEPRPDKETRPVNLYLNFIIRYR